jgi:hypothetical protein
MKFICDKCGYEIENEHNCEVKNCIEKSCPICQGKLFTEQELKDREEMARLIDEDKEDENIAESEALEDLKTYMIDDICQFGYEKVWHDIEKVFVPEERCLYRKVFFELGGVVPVGEAINI